MKPIYTIKSNDWRGYYLIMTVGEQSTVIAKRPTFKEILELRKAYESRQ